MSTARPAGPARTRSRSSWWRRASWCASAARFGHETLRVSDAGIAVLAETLAKNRGRRDAHELLVERVAREMTRAGRLAWRGLAVRARVGEQWQIAMPDVFSIRHTTVEAYLEPIVHEVKVQRSDLLADLRRATKREAYLQLGGECWYVVKDGIAEPDEIPLECGVLVADAGGLTVARPAPRRPTRMTFPALDGAGPGDAGRRLAARGRAGRARRRRRRAPDDAALPPSPPAPNRPKPPIARQDRRARRALWLALLLILLWGANFTVQKAIFNALSPGGFLFVRYLIMPVAAAILLCSRYGLRWPRVSRADAFALLRLGLIGHLLHVGLVTYGIHWSTAFSSSLILACGPIFTLFILHWHGHEKLTRGQVAGVAVACCGVLAFLSDKLFGGHWQAERRRPGAADRGVVLLLLHGRRQAADRAPRRRAR